MVTKGIDLSDEQIACLLFDVAREENESAAPKPVSLMKALLGGTYQAGDVQLFVAIDWQDADSEVKEAAQQLSKQLHATIGYWQNWPNIPPGANIISFMLDDDGSVGTDGVWRTPTKPKAATDRKTKAVYVSSVELINGRYKIDGDKRRWCRAAKLCVEHPKYERYFRGKADGVCMPIEEFVPFLKRVG